METTDPQPVQDAQTDAETEEDADDASESFAHKVRRLNSTAQAMRLHSLKMHQLGANCRERAQQLDRELDDVLKALPQVPEAEAVRWGLERLQRRASVLASISEKLIEQTSLVHEESDAVEWEMVDLEEKALALANPE